jgi:hypothetical protein
LGKVEKNESDLKKATNEASSWDQITLDQMPTSSLTQD